jgi:phosphopantetheinyl transferase (holo-ACP synthase)
VLIELDTSGKQCSLLPNQEAFYVSVGQQLFFTVGVATPAERFAGVGLTAEVLRPVESAQRDAIFTSTELTLLRAAAAEVNESAGSWLRFGRAAKEAFSKAKNSTLPAELSKIEIDSIDAVHRRFSVQSAMAFVTNGDSRSQSVEREIETPTSIQEPADGADVYCRIHEQHVLAICFIPRETTN